VIVDRVWHFLGKAWVPERLRETPLELSEADLAALVSSYDVMLCRDDAGKVVLGLDIPHGGFHQR